MKSHFTGKRLLLYLAAAVILQNICKVCFSDGISSEVLQLAHYQMKPAERSA